MQDGHVVAAVMSLTIALHRSEGNKQDDTHSSMQELLLHASLCMMMFVTITASVIVISIFDRVRQYYYPAFRTRSSCRGLRVSLSRG